MKTTRIIFIAAMLGSVLRPCTAAPPLVYESPGEFFASGDFNGDGNADVLVLDKITGNVRVGYGNGSGNLSWSAPLLTGAQNPTGCAVGFFLQTSRQALAVTSPTLNCVNLVDLSNSNSAPSPVVVTPLGIGPHTVVALANPLGSGTPPAYNDLLSASSYNSDSAELLDLMGVNAGAATETGQYPESGPFDRGNALQVSNMVATFAAGIVRGTNDTLDIWQFASSPGVMLSFSNLVSGSDYAFGVFNDSSTRFIFYLPGDTNLTIATLAQSGGNLSLTNVIETNVAEPIEGIFYLALSGGGDALIEFTNGVEGMSVSNGVISFASLYSAGAQSGNVFSGVVPMATGQFTLLDAPPGNPASAHAQVIGFDGHIYTQKSLGNLPPTTTRSTRASVWLFETEPFVNRQAGFVASLTDPDWTDSSTGLPSSVSVQTETFGGLTNGLGSPVTNNLGAPPLGTTNVLVNQYNPAISLFSYGAAQPAQPVTVTISPPPGPYDASVSVSFSTLNGSDHVYYRVGSNDTYHVYASAFTITNDNTVLYFGTNAAQPQRAQLQFAAYTVGDNNQISLSPNSPNITGNTNGGTNAVSSTNIPNIVISTTVGTLFYGRRSVSNNGTIWAINLDGSDDTYITQGVRPRASRDGLWVAFLREGNPFNSQGNLWIRNMQTGVEQRLLVNASTIVGYDWEPDDSGLVLDYGCGIWRLGIDGSLTQINSNCNEQAPTLGPQTEQIAFHNLYNPWSNSSAGIWVTAPDGNSPKRIVSTVSGASWPEWSPDGKLLCFVDSNSVASLDDGTNLWVVSPDGGSLNRICDFAGTGDHFPHGAIWSPDSTSLVGAGTINETNGIWIIPLNADRTDCGGSAILLPTTPGDALDFAGSVVIGSAKPLIVVQPQSTVLQLGQAGGASVNAVGGLPLHYEWIKDGILLPGQTNSTLSFASFQFTNSGIYRVLVTNPWGMAMSYPVRVALSNAPLRGSGDDYYGEVGTSGSNIVFGYGLDAPVLVASNVVTVATGSFYTLYVDAEGNLWALGHNIYGYLGTGGMAIAYTPAFVTNNVVAVAAGAQHSLFLTADGTLWGMGLNAFGQLGDGTTNNSYSPERLATNVVTFAAGEYHSMFVTADGNLWTMGHNGSGQLGDGTSNTVYDSGSDVPLNVADNVVAVSAGGTHSLFVTADGTLWGMGSDEYGQLGGETVPLGYGEALTLPAKMATNVVGVSAGIDHTLYLTADGTLWGTGYDFDGELGNGVSEYYVYEPIPITNHVVAMEGCVSGSLFVTTDGREWAMGNSYEGMLGIGGGGFGLTTYVPVPVNAGNMVTATLGTGMVSFDALEVAAEVPVFGVYSNQTVAIGGSILVGSDLDESDVGYTPSIYFDLPFYYQWQLNGVDIAGATNGTYAVASASASDAGVYTLVVSNNFTSFLSLNNAIVTVLTPPGAPVITQQPFNTSAVPGLPLSLTVGASGGGVPVEEPLRYEWIKDGVLLTSKTNRTLSFGSFQFTDIGTYQVVVSNAYGLVISIPALVGVSNAPLRGWGLDDDGQLGDGYYNYYVAQPEVVTNDVVTAALGAYHSLFVTGDGTLWGMGYDYDGELGDGTPDIQYSPEELATNVVAVAAGEYHSLYITADGTLWSMGLNDWGQLGTYNFPNSVFAQPVATNVVAVAAGGHHSLYLTADGTLWGMGRNADGELGDGSYTGQIYPEILATNVVAMSGGDLCSFYITADGKLWGMGDNSEGELGDGQTEINTNLAEQIATNVIAVSAGGYPSPYLNVGGYHSMFLTADNNLWVMGYNGDGELGDSGDELSTNVPEMVASDVVAISAGGAQSFYVTSNGGLWAAGDNSYSELGQGYDGGGGSTPMQYRDGDLIAASLAKGESALHALVIAGEAPAVYLPSVLTTNGQPFTFSPVIQLGDGPFTYQWSYLGEDIEGATNPTYTVLDALPDYVGDFYYGVYVTGPYGGNYATAAYYFPAPPVVGQVYVYPYTGQAGAGDFGYVYASGYNPFPTTYQWLKDGVILPGQNGNAIYLYSFGLTNTGAYQVVLSNSAGIAISQPALLSLSNAPLEVWGANNDGQLGFGNSSNILSPATLTSNAVVAAAGADFSFYVTADQNLWAMGLNNAGQLGNGTRNNASVPQSITNNVLAIAAGGAHSLFLMEGGSLWGMGADESGELGDGTNITELLPEELATNVVAVAAGQAHSLYLTGDGTLWAMGQNADGQLGNGTTNNALTPGIVTSNVIAIAAGGRHSLYLTADWNLWAMGLNGSGQLGNGSTNNALLPVLVATNVTALAAGDAHSLFVTADGNLWAVGQNSHGQLGIGNNTSIAIPAMVATNVASVSAGANHSLYLTRDGRVWGIGLNTSGQLGNGTVMNTSLPVSVAAGGLVAADLAEGPEANHALAIAMSVANPIPPTIVEVTVGPNPGGPGRTIILTVSPSQSYIVLVSTDLKTWTSLGRFSPNASAQLIITDTGATAAPRFYRLQVE